MHQEERDWNIIAVRESLDNNKIKLKDLLEQIVSKIPKLCRWWEHDPRFKKFSNKE
jgi:hypothetical protein